MIDQDSLPYTIDRPADASQIVKEITWLAVLVAGIMHPNPRLGAEMIEDWTKEPGRSIGVQSLRLSLALETYVGSNDLELLQSVGEMTQEMLGTSVEGLEKAGYIHRHLDTPGADNG